MADNRFGTLITHLVAGAVGAGIVLGAQTMMQPQSTGPNPAEFGNQVREFLKANPDAIIDALKQYQSNEQQKQLEIAKQIIVKAKPELYNNPFSPVIGNKDGDVTLVEFFDYNCHYCRGAEPDVLKLQAEDPKLRVVHKHLPILGPSSVEATKVALAVYMQKPAAYEAITKAFMSHDGALTSADIEKAARDTGVDWNRVLVDKESDAVKNEIKANYELAAKLGLSGTPGFVIGDNLMAGAQSEAQLKEAVDGARKAGWKIDPAAAVTSSAPGAAAPSTAPDAKSSAAPAPDAGDDAAATPTPQDAVKMPGDSKAPEATAPTK